MVIVAVLCLVGVLLSCLSISGTWFVVGGALLAAVVRWGEFPGFWTVLGFVVVSVLVEVAEAFAGTWGVARRGGSALAGVAALVGGIVGLILGAMLPLPVLGPLLGMTAGSFGLVFVVERQRLKHSGQAANIAWGTVLARMLVLMLKVIVTLGMIAYLFVGMIRS